MLVWKPSHCPIFWPLIPSVDSILFSLAVRWGLFLKSLSAIKNLEWNIPAWSPQAGRMRGHPSMWWRLGCGRSRLDYCSLNPDVAWECRECGSYMSQPLSHRLLWNMGRGPSRGPDVGRVDDVRPLNVRWAVNVCCCTFWWFSVCVIPPLQCLHHRWRAPVSQAEHMCRNIGGWGGEASHNICSFHSLMWNQDVSQM